MKYLILLIFLLIPFLAGCDPTITISGEIDKEMQKNHCIGGLAQKEGDGTPKEFPNKKILYLVYVCDK